jgi:hypothetical protein
MRRYRSARVEGTAGTFEKYLLPPFGAFANLTKLRKKEKSMNIHAVDFHQAMWLFGEQSAKISGKQSGGEKMQWHLDLGVSTP